MYIDGLECGYFTREVFEDLRRGSVNCVTPTLAFWEDAGETMDAIGRWRDLVEDNKDVATIARTGADIAAAKESGRVAVLLGTQNSSPIEDRLRYIELFHDMGLRVMQITYNNQNAIGGSCYEPSDSGLARFGHQVVREMNRVGMLIDLSHVGQRTCLEAIGASEKPVAITHANATDLYDHPRNKRTDVLKALAGNRGVIGLATYRNICGPWAESAAKWAEMVARTVDIAGIDSVGIGTDYGWDNSMTDLDWMRRGRWTREQQFGAGSASNPGKQPPPDWFPSPGSFPLIAEALGERGMTDTEVAAVMGGNWLRVYTEVFGC